MRRSAARAPFVPSPAAPLRASGVAARAPRPPRRRAARCGRARARARLPSRASRSALVPLRSLRGGAGGGARRPPPSASHSTFALGGALAFCYGALPAAGAPAPPRISPRLCVTFRAADTDEGEYPAHSHPEEDGGTEGASVGEEHYLPGHSQYRSRDRGVAAEAADLFGVPRILATTTAARGGGRDRGEATEVAARARRHAAARARPPAAVVRGGAPGRWSAVAIEVVDGALTRRRRRRGRL